MSGTMDFISVDPVSVGTGDASSVLGSDGGGGGWGGVCIAWPTGL